MISRFSMNPTKPATTALLLFLAALSLPISACAAPGDAESRPLRAVSSLDLPRYLGRWYEIAKYPNRFQKKCAGFTRADYSATPNGEIRVINSCRLSSGETEEALGTARTIDPAESAKLEVRFAPAWLPFLPWVWGKYWVIDIDDDYQLVAVSEPTREYLWILARSPQVAPEHYDALLRRLQAMGFDTSRLESTLQ